ncbi:TAXI family TRAP transporter solute-binding subunit [Nocardiopsis sp. MG754419]|uniref:TAXI family TRAP transporter solute-binding subunit n=1 Tax=Nocardiopsis sp. MG754419 TaxID=2259865 RepID=UPI001BA8C65B|nr:TAXI family TRAP transporter solute-binding subunit [Nocardiopsis sp. MG754419]MBR8743123.1 C4-dicarboxylate ABC transporter substrate-binding protein [Nocardiopsis sp. MG754419]
MRRERVTGTLSRRQAILGLTGAASLVAVSGCTPDPAPELRELVVATGPPGAVYREIGGQLALLLDERVPHTEVIPIETRASHDNLYLLEDGTAHLGLANLDSVLATEIEAEALISAVGRLYDSFVHLVVPYDSPVDSLADLEGLRVSLGAVNSGTEFTAEQILDVTGVRFEEIRLDQADSAEALDAGRIDAMFSLTGLPTPAIADLAEERPLRLVDLSDTADTMVKVYPEAYFPATIPATTYSGIPACPTMSIPNLLLCRQDLPEELVRQVTAAVYTGAAHLAEQRPEAAQINVRTGISTGIVPLHPGAEQWYRENKPA